MKRQHESVLPFLAAIGNRLAQRLSFQPDPGFYKLFKIFHRQGCNKEPTLFLALDQPFCGKSVQRLAHGNRANVVALGYRFDLEFLIGQQNPLQDVAPDKIIHLF